jgi:hypothetical protein
VNTAKRTRSRREFLASAACLGGAMALGAPPQAGTVTPVPLPTVKFGKAQVTRLIIGSNPFYAFMHFNNLYARFVREWMTQDQRMEILHRAEKAGINTWQSHYATDSLEDLKRYRDEGGKMNWLVLADFDLMKDWKLLPSVARLNPIGIAHHGNRTDERFRANEMNVVQDFCKAVHDAGVPAGISTHNPAVVDFVEEHGWSNDYYQTCLYRVTRTPAEARAEFGESPVGEIYMEKDPERMCAMIRKTKKTCFAFKLLGAGRQADSPAQVQRAFRFALTNIKPQDATIVGMCPKFKDEISENVALVRRITDEMARG